MYLKLALIIVMILIVLLVLHKKDIAAPSILLCLIYLLSMALCATNWDVWDLDSFSSETVKLIVISILSFSIPELLISYCFKKRNRITRSRSGMSDIANGEINAIPIGNLVKSLNFILCLLCDAWLAFVAIRQNGVLGIVGVGGTTLSVPTLLTILERYVRIQGYFFTVVFIYNYVNKHIKLKEIFWYMISIFSTCFIPLLNGSRMEIIQLFGCAAIAYYFSIRRRKGKRRGFYLGIVVKAATALAVFLVLFYKLKYFKDGDSSEFTPIYYITLYLGASIKLFDLYLKQPVKLTGIWGEETFPTLNYNLKSLHIIEKTSERHLEFRGLYDTYSLGNVYGAPRRYYHDFGMVGLIVLIVILSIIISLLYYSIKYSKKDKIDFKWVLFCYLFPIIPMFPIDDIFYTNISIGYVFNILYLYILYLIVIKRKIVIKFGRIVS